jgi:hypothetical protein
MTIRVGGNLELIKPSWKRSRWLMSVGREEEAIRSLARLHARGDINDPFVIHEAAEIKSGVMFEKESEQGWKKVSSRARVRCAEWGQGLI